MTEPAADTFDRKLYFRELFRLQPGGLSVPADEPVGNLDVFLPMFGGADATALDPALPEPWLKVADSMAPDATGDDIGLLGRGKQAVDASLASREAITALLSSVASPAAE